MQIVYLFSRLREYPHTESSVEYFHREEQVLNHNQISTKRGFICYLLRMGIEGKKSPNQQHRKRNLMQNPFADMQWKSTEAF